MRQNNALPRRLAEYTQVHDHKESVHEVEQTLQRVINDMVLALRYALGGLPHDDPIVAQFRKMAELQATFFTRDKNPELRMENYLVGAWEKVMHAHYDDIVVRDPLESSHAGTPSEDSIG